MKKLIFIFIVLLLAVNVNAQTINGTVVDEHSNPIVFANVVLQDSVNQNIAGIETNNFGKFILQNISLAGNYKLSISFVGYETFEFDIEKFNKNIDLDTIVLFAAATELEGAVIKSTRAKITDDRRIVYPTQRQLEITADGITLLNAMKLPRLLVVPATTEVKYFGEGTLLFYINDRQASIKQVRALSPKDIVRVEYIDVPGLEYGAGVGLVIKYITKPVERGVTSSISIDKPLNRNSGEADIISRFNYKNSEFSVNYDGTYNRTHYFDAVKTNETFNLPTGTLYRNEDEISLNQKEIKNNIAMLYQYSRPQKEVFYIKAEYAFVNSPYHNSTSVLYNQGLRNDTTLKYDLTSEKQKIYSAVLVFTKYFSNSQYLYFSAMYNNTQINSYRNYKEVDNTTDLADIYTDVFDKSYYLRLNAIYYIKLSKKIGLQTSLLDVYLGAKDIYKGTYASSSYIKRNLIEFSNRLSFKSEKFSSNFSINMNWNNKKTGDESTTEFTIQPVIDGRYVFNSRNYIAYRFTLFKNLPQMYALSSATQIIDDIQRRRGNPNLKSGLIFDPRLNGNIGVGKFDINWNARYSFYKDWVGEQTYLENGFIVRMPVNMENIHMYITNCEISPDLFDWLSLSLGLNYDIYVNDRKYYKRIYDNFHISFDATATWNKWSFSTVIWTPKRVLLGENLWKQEPAVYFTLLRTWFDGKLSTSLTVYNPIKKYYFKENNINYSALAPYENELYYNSSYQMLMFNISYKFNVGRKSSSTSVKTNFEAETGIISSSKSAK
jgi:hypothetical protein